MDMLCMRQQIKEKWDGKTASMVAAAGWGFAPECAVMCTMKPARSRALTEKKKQEKKLRCNASFMQNFMYIQKTSIS